MSDFTGQDRIPVEYEGEEVDVWNAVSVEQSHVINSVNGYETFDGSIRQGEDQTAPVAEYVTPRVARLLWDEFSIDVGNRDDVEVLDPDSDEVTRL